MFQTTAILAQTADGRFVIFNLMQKEVVKAFCARNNRGYKSWKDATSALSYHWTFLSLGTIAAIPYRNEI